MKVRIVLAALAAFLGGMPVSGQERAPVELMVLGTYHMGNPGQDQVNARADDVTRPERQRQLQAITDAIARWQPTKVLIEVQAPAPFTIARFHRFTPAELSTNPNEIWQLGFRLARQLGHPDVYGFDEQPGDGEPSYYQYDRIAAFAAANGRQQAMDEARDFFQRGATAFEQAQATRSVAELLLRYNDPDYNRQDNNRGYYYALPFGDADNQAGAEFNAFWYLRNAKMFAKIALIAQPGDRVLVLVGSGHRYWLTHFAENVPGYRSIDPRPYLQEAAAQR